MLLAVAIGVAGAITAWWPQKEPTYEGRALSSWLRDFDSEQKETRWRAAVVLRQMGTNVVPSLVTLLERSDPVAARDRSRWWWQQRANWLDETLYIDIKLPRPRNVRSQTLAALDVLGPKAKDALPALEALLKKNPPDPRALFVVARIGEAGVPLLERSLTNTTSSEARLLRLQARCCLDMMASNSPVLYPPDSDPEAQYLQRRLTKFDEMVSRAALQEYQAKHPEVELPIGGPPY